MTGAGSDRGNPFPLATPLRQDRYLGVESVLGGEHPVLLVFGLSAFFRTVGEGVFHCQACGGDRGYRRRIGRRWFTLFFPPVIPLDRLGEVVECRTCRTRFRPAVLRLPTVEQMTAALPAGMRAAAALVLRAGVESDETARRRAVEAVRGYGEEYYDDDALEGDLGMPAAFLAEEIATGGAQLAVEAKEWFLAQAVRVGLADGPLTEPERQTLHDVAGHLGMTHAHALGVIAMTEGAAK
jgi:hypothetical protein